MDYVAAAGLQVAKPLHAFVNERAVPGTGVSADAFWSGFAALVKDLAPRCKALLAERDRIQAQVDDWHKAHKGKPIDQDAYIHFLRDIGYLVEEPVDVTVHTSNVDHEIALIAGPQLVVPVTNARYALNAANARWHSLYDSLYGTDAIPEDNGATRSGGYNKVRGALVIAKAREVLDLAATLAHGSHKDAVGYAIVAGALLVKLADGTTTELKNPHRLAGYRGNAADPSDILFRHNGLHIELVINRAHPIGKDDPAGIADVIMEAAITTIQDCEDSVSCVDAADKILAYTNGLGLMNGTLEDSFE